MAKESKNTIIVAIISAVSAVVIALITTFGTILFAAPGVEIVKDDLKGISDLKKEMNLQEIKKELERISDFKLAYLPVGTIVASLLSPSLFADEVGDTYPYNPKESKWILADAQTEIATSQYGKLLDKQFTPDLRGMFLRGMNVKGGADPNNNRKVGIPQDDDFKKHSHIIGETWYNEGTRGERYEQDTGPVKKGNFRTLEEGGDETRPKNVAVYFYIKIN